MKTIIKAPPRRNPQSADATTKRPENAATGKRLHYRMVETAIFLAITLPLLFAMCATGRPGA